MGQDQCYTLGTMAGDTIDVSRLRADIIAYVQQPTGLRRLWGRWVRGTHQARYLLLAQGTAYLVVIRGEREVVSEVFGLAEVHGLRIERTPAAIALNFSLHGAQRRIALANDKLVTFRDPEFPNEPSEPPPLTMAEQAAAYVAEWADQVVVVADVA